MNPLQTITLAEQRRLELLAEAADHRRNHPAPSRQGRVARLFRGHRSRRFAGAH